MELIIMVSKRKDITSPAEIVDSFLIRDVVVLELEEIQSNATRQLEAVLEAFYEETFA